jgi:hypothetical protein
MNYDVNIVEVLLGLVIVGLSWWMQTLWKDHRETSIKLAALELMIAKEYRTKAEGDKIIEDIMRKLASVPQLEIMMATYEAGRISTDRRLAGIEDRLASLLEEVVKRDNK